MIAIAYGCIIETALKDLKICTEAHTLERVSSGGGMFYSGFLWI